MHQIRQGLIGLAVVFALFAPTVAVAQSQSPSQQPITDLAPVAVVGVQPGPALWKVSKGDHVMWVLGITSPLPVKMQWKADEVESTVATSQQVLKPPGLEIGARVGFVGKLLLLPSLMGMKKNPDGATLQQVLPADVYQRWETQRAKYLGRGDGVEQLRPLFAGKKLYEAALARSGLSDSGAAQQTVAAIAGRYKVPQKATAYRLIVDDPRAALKTFKGSSMDDVQCLRNILDATGNDLAQATVRASAWATGDIGLLRNTLASRQQDACLAAIGDADFARKLGMGDVSQRIEQSWLASARDAIENNRQSFALLPMEQVILPRGYLATLQAEGYRLESPEEQ